MHAVGLEEDGKHLMKGSCCNPLYRAGVHTSSRALADHNEPSQCGLALKGDVCVEIMCQQPARECLCHGNESRMGKPTLNTPSGDEKGSV